MTSNPTVPISKRSIYLLLIALIIVWGLSWPIAKMGLAYMSPMWFLTYRLVMGTAVMFFIVIILKKFVWPTKQDLKIIFVLGIFQVAFFMAFIILGLSEVSAGRSAILVYTTPIWVVPISIFFFKERASLLKWLGFVLGLAGIIVLFNPKEIDWSNHQVVIGNTFLLLAALCWAISILCARYMKWTRSPLELISWQLLVATIPITLFTLIKYPHSEITWNPTLIFSLLYNGTLATSFAYWGSVVISKELPPITTSLSLLAIPVCALFFSAIMLHEAITLTTILAMIFVLGGVLSVVIPTSAKFEHKRCP